MLGWGVGWGLGWVGGWEWGGGGGGGRKDLSGDGEGCGLLDVNAVDVAAMTEQVTNHLDMPARRSPVHRLRERVGVR